MLIYKEKNKAEQEYLRLSKVKNKASEKEQVLTDVITIEEQKHLPEIFGVTFQQSVGTEETHDAFNGLMQALIDFEVVDNPKITTEDIGPRISKYLNEFINALTKQGFSPKYITFGGIIINHREILKNIKIPSPIA